MARPKLRKMLGDASSPEVAALMRLMETQSARTLAAWAIDFARDNYLPIFEAESPGDGRPRTALNDCRARVDGVATPEEARRAISQATAAAREQTLPAAQAAARAIAGACTAVRTPTSALGLVFYGAAATAYSTLGTQRPAAEYDAHATREFERAHAALQRVAVPDEPDPAKLIWNC